MIKDAEIAMYHAKHDGGDRIECSAGHAGPAHRSPRSKPICAAPSSATRSKVLFQPVVRLQDRTIAGFEALVRWDHPKLGRLPPQEFIAMAEETGLIVDARPVRA